MAEETATKNPPLRRVKKRALTHHRLVDGAKKQCAGETVRHASMNAMILVGCPVVRSCLRSWPDVDERSRAIVQRSALAGADRPRGRTVRRSGCKEDDHDLQLCRFKRRDAVRPASASRPVQRPSTSKARRFDGRSNLREINQSNPGEAVTLREIVQAACGRRDRHSSKHLRSRLSPSAIRVVSIAPYPSMMPARGFPSSAKY